MSKNTEPLIPGEARADLPRHASRTFGGRVRAIAAAGFRSRRVRVIGAASIVVALGVAVAVVVWSHDETPSNNVAATGPDAAGADLSDDGSPSTDPVAVPTYAPPGHGGSLRDGGHQATPGLPTDLRAEVSGDKVVLTWTDNTSDEDGFTIFVTQRPLSYQVDVPANTTSYDGITARGDTRTCFAVVPFKWSNPVVAYPSHEFQCTARR